MPVSQKLQPKPHSGSHLPPAWPGGLIILRRSVLSFSFLHCHAEHRPGGCRAGSVVILSNTAIFIIKDGE